MNKILKRACIVFLSMLVFFAGLFFIEKLLDYKNCIYSVATSEYKTRVIDSMLLTYSDLNQDSGSFSLNNLECRQKAYLGHGLFIAEQV